MLALFDLDLTGRTLVALGACFAGVGSILSGIAALKKCKEKAEDRLWQKRLHGPPEEPKSEPA